MNGLCALYRSIEWTGEYLGCSHRKKALRLKEVKTMLNRLDDMLNFNTQALRIREQRQQVLASNIANADTPNYKARDLDFKTALQSALRARPRPTARRWPPPPPAIWRATRAWRRKPGCCTARRPRAASTATR